MRGLLRSGQADGGESQVFHGEQRYFRKSRHRLSETGALLAGRESVIFLCLQSSLVRFGHCLLTYFYPGEGAAESRVVG